jgi:hypothetical protein
MWTRFLPIAMYISDLVKGGTLGDVRIVWVAQWILNKVLIAC